MATVALLLLVGLGLARSAPETCFEPILENGVVDGEGGEHLWTGTFSCDPGYTLVGNTRLKCRKGVWSSSLPTCTAMGKCDPSDLPEISHGEKKSHKPGVYRGSVYKYKCDRGFRMHGSSLLTCTGDQGWDLTKLPLCARPGCDETLVSHLPYGQAKRRAKGAVYVFKCNDGSTMDGSSTVICDGHHWNSSAPICLIGPQSVSIGGANTLVQGQASGFSCVSSSSNPPSDIVWQVEDAMGNKLSSVLQESEPVTSWTGHGWETESSVIFTPESGLTWVMLTCAATNPTLGETASAEKKLRLQYAPDRVSVSGPSRVRAGEQVVLSCSSSPSVPAASLRWTVKQGGEGSLRDDSAEVEVEQKLDGSFITHSHLRIQAGAGPDLEAVCYGTNEVLGGDSVALVHNVEIISPPGVPTISGVQPHSSVQHLNCSTSAGRPPAQLSWYRGREMMDSHYTVDGDTVSAVITFVPSHTAEEELTCEASNDALSEPIRNTITIQLSTTSSSTMLASTTTVTSSSTESWIKLLEQQESAVQAETKSSGDGYEDEYNYDEYDEDDLPDYIFNDTDATEEREKSSQPAILVESNEIPGDGAAAAESEEEDATRDVEPGNIEVEATREGKILGGARVKSLEAAAVSREEVVLTSEEAIRDPSSVQDEELMKMEESRDDTAADEKAEKGEKVETKEPERGRSEALSSTAPPSLVAFSLMSMITFLTILASNSISSLAVRT